MLGTKRKPINPVISGIPQVLPADLTRRCCPDSMWGMCWGAATAGAGRENPSRRKEPQELCPGCSSRGSWALCPPWGRRISPEQPQPQEPPEILHPSSPGAPSESISPPDTADQGVGQRHQGHLISFNSSGFRGFFSPYEGNWSLFFTAHPPTSKKTHQTTEFHFCSELGDGFAKDKGVHVTLDLREAGTEEVPSGHGQNSKEIEV